MIPIFHRYNPSKNHPTLQSASLRDRVIAQLIDSVFLGVVCSLVLALFSRGKIYSTWVAPIVPQFLLQLNVGAQSVVSHFWWGGYFFSVQLPYGKDIFINYPAPLLWLVYCLYYTIFTSLMGQSPGKMMKRLVILNSSKSMPSISISFFRWGLYYLCLIPLGLGFWWRDIGKDQKTWHDKICRTQVYRF